MHDMQAGVTRPHSSEGIMAKLTAGKEKQLKASQFGLPAKKGPNGGVQGKYPMPDASHAANAKARATQMVGKGKLSPSEKSKIDAKANKVIASSKGKK
jgi:hypothetical protein